MDSPSRNSSSPSPDSLRESRFLSTAARPSADDNVTVSAADNSDSSVCDAPAVVGKYTILEAGLMGGMGIVYKVRDAELDRIVALKVIKGGAFASQEAVLRFHREARAAARLNHPNIIAVYEIGQERGCPYFTMAFASGGSLSQQRERFADPRAAAALLETIARAVHHAHENGILHRDLKPANILFDERGIPLVSDFSLAKFIDANMELTRTGQLLGTPSYMAPEQASGLTDQVSVQTDVWALGVILYELLTGFQPFKGLSQEEQLRKVRTAEPPRPRSLDCSLDRALETVVLKCLEKEPSQRYASAEALADDLARWQRGEPVLAQPPSWPIRAGRAIRRYRAVVFRSVFAAVLFVLLALAWKGLSSSVPPVEEGDRKAMEKRLNRLRRGDKVTLLGESGLPAWFRWQPRQWPGTRVDLDNNRVFRVHADRQPALIELLPSAPKRYRLYAQVQHTDSQADHGRVGIYFAHGMRPTDEGAIHCFFRVDFNDRFPTVTPRDAIIPPMGQVLLNLPILFETGASSHQVNVSALGRHFFPSGEVEPMPWRKLEVEVTPEWIKTFWEGELVRAEIADTISGGGKTDGADPKKVLEKANLIRPWREVQRNEHSRGQLVSDEEIALGEGLGLYVERGVAAFRSVVIEPLPPQ